jgi:uncharacterized membrane protein
MEKNALNISLSIIFAALYAVGVIALAPISYLPLQVRVADALLPLSIVFGWSAIIGFTMGTAVANYFSGFGLIDIVGGALANFLATYLAYKITRKKFKGNWVIAVVAQIVTVTIIVGGYLSYLENTLLALPGVFVGSLIATGLLGSAILAVVNKMAFFRMVKARLGTT